jgi:hypothetical protein
MPCSLLHRQLTSRLRLLFNTLRLHLSDSNQFCTRQAQAAMDHEMKYRILTVYTLIALLFFLATLFTAPSTGSSESAERGNIALALIAIFHEKLARSFNGGNEVSISHITELPTTWGTGHQSSQFQAIALVFISWLRFQFILMEYGAKILAWLSFFLFQFSAASAALIPSKQLDPSRCQQGLGAETARSKECKHCWSDITPEQQSIEHIQCRNAFHQDCFDAWISSRREEIPTCILCQAPLTVDTSRRVATTALSYQPAGLALLLKRCSLTTASNLLALVATLCVSSDSLPLERHWSIRLCGIMTLSGFTWAIITVIVGLSSLTLHILKALGLTDWIYRKNFLVSLLFCAGVLQTLVVDPIAAWIGLTGCLYFYSMSTTLFLSSMLMSDYVELHGQPEVEETPANRFAEKVLRTLIVWAW